MMKLMELFPQLIHNLNVVILLKLLAKALQSVGAKADQREGGTQTSSCAQEECALLCGNSLTLFSLLTFQ